MTQKYIKKNLALSLEFDRRVVRNPDIMGKVPNGACIIITTKGDESFNRESRSLAQKFTKGGEKCFEAKKEGSRWSVKQFAY
ncbi:MAG: hypothetical protein Q8R55_02155 [Candidatus Taylorbacteria bacterium]|nr:hypothetical protein [Candidatus Taylorbacteria bacterium]